MKRSKRRRQVVYCRAMDIEDRVEFFKTHVATAKEYFDSDLQTFLGTLGKGMLPAHEQMRDLLRSDPEALKDLSEEQLMIRSFMGHMIRYTFIHVFAQFDHWALLSLDVYGRMLEKDVSYTDDSGGALRVLPQFLTSETSAGLEQVRSRMEFYLALRNQFAHYPYDNEGCFHLSARQDSFESLIRKESGIECGQASHAYKLGRPGYLIRYTITGDELARNLIAAAKKYYNTLLDEWMREVHDVHGATSPPAGSDL